MSALGRQLIDLALGDRQADRVVPPTGFTARLTVFAAAAMTFLAVFILALSLAGGRLASSWSNELANTATIRIVAPTDEIDAQTQAVMTLLRTTAGVAASRALDSEEQAALLEPWFGQELLLDGLPLPQLIELRIDPELFDPAGVRLRLSAETPGAVLDMHGRWRAPLLDSAARLRFVGWGAAILILLAMAAMVNLAANAALSANAQIISVLRLVGATDHYIAKAFIRRFTIRAFIGSAIGSFCALILIWILPASNETGGFLTGIGFSGSGLLIPFALPLICAAVAFVTTLLSARRALQTLT